jgi:hypothetical protein
MPDLKKKQVTRERLVTYLSSLPTPLGIFQEEVKKLLSVSQRQIANKCLAAENGVKEEYSLDFVLTKVLQAYNLIGVYQNKNAENVPPITKNEKALNLYELIYKKVCSCKRKVDLIRHYMSMAVKAETSSYRGYLYKKIIGMQANLHSQAEEVNKQISVNEKEIVELLAFTVDYLESWTIDDLNIIRHVTIWLDEFSKYYLEETTKMNTLPRNQDESCMAMIRKEVDSLKELTFSKNTSSKLL